MSLRLLSWNVEGRLSPFSAHGRGTPQQIVDEIIRHNADVVFLAEAADGENVAPETIAQLQDYGYDIHTVRYEDKGEWYLRAENDPVMKFLTRVPVRHIRQIRPGDIRSMPIIEVSDPETGVYLKVIGVHLDDRSEAGRMLQLPQLAQEINESILPCVVVGDFNAMHSYDWRSRALRSWVFGVVARTFSRRLTRDVLRRVHDMAAGTVLAELEQTTGLVDADPHHRPTTTPKQRGQGWLPSIRLVQLDHVFISQQLRVVGFHIAHDGGSDHRAISATISIHPNKH